MTHQISLVERRSNFRFQSTILQPLYSTSATVTKKERLFVSITFWPQISVYARTSAQTIVDSIHLVAGVGADMGAVEAPITISKTITDIA